MNVIQGHAHPLLAQEPPLPSTAEPPKTETLPAEGLTSEALAAGRPERITRRGAA